MTLCLKHIVYFRAGCLLAPKKGLSTRETAWLWLCEWTYEQPWCPS